MVTVLHLPPQEAPKQLTAYRHNTKLEEHLLAFLNANNKNGFAEELEEGQEPTPVEPISIETIREMSSDAVVSVILQIAISEHISIRRIKEMGRLIVTESGKKAKYHKTIHLIARMLGYRSYEGMIFLNGYVKPKPIEYPKGKSSTDLRRNIHKGNKSLIRQSESLKIKNRRDPSSFRIKDFIES